MKKTLFGCVFAVTAVIGLVGCGGDDNSTKPSYDYSVVEGEMKDSRDGDDNSTKPSYDYSVVEGEMKDSRDGQVYKTVTIGTQTWMAENLNYAYTGVKYAYAGNISDSTSWCYNNIATNCDKYGRLYTWSAAMDSAAHFSQNENTKCGYGTICTPNTPHRGVCPEGWHIPNDDEWNTLWAAVGGTSTAGTVMKSTSGWRSGEGTNKYGFSVLPSGNRYYDGDFMAADYNTDFWSSSENDRNRAYYWDFSNNGNVIHYNNNKDFGFSVRCLRDSK